MQKAVFLSIAAFVAVAVGIWFATQRSPQIPAKAASSSEQPVSAVAPDPTVAVPSGSDVGSTSAPPALAGSAPAVNPHPDVTPDDVEPLPPTPLPEFASTESAHVARVARDGYGTLPRVPADTSPQAKAVLEALTTGKHGSRLSSAIPAAPFDADKWRNDDAWRQQYSSVSEANRAYQAAKPAPGVPRFKRIGAAYREVFQQEEIALQFECPAGYPASIFTMDSGQFRNGLSYATQVANANGIVTFHLTPTSGVINHCRIAAASPLASGVQHLTIDVKLPPQEN